MVQFIEDYSLQNISNRINRRRSQTSIPYIKILVCFFAGEQYMETPVEVSMKVQIVSGVLSRVSIWNVNYLQVCFCGIGSSLIFFSRGKGVGVGGVEHIKQKISCFLVFLEKRPPLSFSTQGKNTMFSGKKRLPFQIVQERSCPGVILFEKTIFSEHLKKISYFCVSFLRKIVIHFLGVRSYFREKEISSFPIIQERSYSSAIFLERPSFQDVWKKKMWFFVQCVLHSWSEERKAAHLRKFREYIPNISDTFCIPANVSQKPGYEHRDRNTTDPYIVVERIDKNASSDSQYRTKSSTISFSDPQTTTEKEFELHHRTSLPKLVSKCQENCGKPIKFDEVMVVQSYGRITQTDKQTGKEKTKRDPMYIHFSENCLKNLCQTLLPWPII